MQHAFGVGTRSPGSTSGVRHEAESVLAAAHAHAAEGKQVGLDAHGAHHLEDPIHALDGTDLAHVQTMHGRHAKATATDPLAHAVSAEAARVRLAAPRVRPTRQTSPGRATAEELPRRERRHYGKGWMDGRRSSSRRDVRRTAERACVDADAWAAGPARSLTRRRTRIARAAALGLLVSLLAAATVSGQPLPVTLADDPERAGADAGGGGAALDASATADDGGVEVALRAEIAAAARVAKGLRAILDGAEPQPGLYLDEMIGEDIVDDAAIARRTRELRAELGLSTSVDGGDAGAAAAANGPRAPGPRRVDAGGGGGDGAATEASDGGDSLADQLAAERRRVASARLELLRLPLDRRRAIDQADRDRRRVAQERQVAVAERERATEDARRADEAKRRALDEAEHARTAAARDLANERARVEGVRSQQARFRARISDDRARVTKAEQPAATSTDDLVERSVSATNGSADADAAYDALVDALVGARRQVREALDGLDATPRAPRLTGGLPTAPLSDPALEARRKELAAAPAALEASADELDVDAKQLAWTTLTAAVAREGRLNDARLSLIDRVSADKHAAVLGLGREGRGQLVREIGRVDMSTRWYLRDAVFRARALRARLADKIFLGELLTALLALVAALAGVAYVRRNGRRAIEAARALVVRTLRRPALVRRIQAGLGALSAVWRDLVPVAALWLAGGTLEHLGVPEVRVAYRVVVRFAWYALATSAAYEFLAWAATEGASHVDEETAAKIQRSVRAAARYALFIAATLVVSEAILGQGYLYRVVLQFAWLGAIPIFIVLIGWWRADIAHAYLARQPTGMLAELVERTRGRWYGFFVAVAAFAAISSRSAGRGVRRFVLGFEQSRKALAYLFRRRLERRTEAVVEVAQPLPDELVAFFSQRALDGAPYAVDRYPGLDVYLGALATWLHDGGIGSFLLVAEAGYGKSSWLAEAVRRTESPTRRIAFTERVRDGDALVRAVARSLGAPDEVADASALAAWLVAGERSVILLDDAHHAVLRGVEALGAWTALGALVEATGHHVFWVATMAHFPHKYVAWRTRGSGAFRRVVQVPGWTEDEIKALLEARMQASGYVPSYDDLVVDRMEGVDGAAQLVSTANEYARLVWDYSDGSPRVALHCWLSSLVAEADRHVRVRLFTRPDANRLEELTEVDRFLLAAVIWHQSLTPADAVCSLRFDPASCAAGFGRLHDMGALVRDGDRYSLSTPWQRAAIRFAYRKHLIEA
ncbi:MAG TPA: hypothetical protein VGM56_26745 [Byssovorax sp.]|jgi:hypothetical protein